jgi:hypothetical protein
MGPSNSSLAATGGRGENQENDLPLPDFENRRCRSDLLGSLETTGPVKVRDRTVILEALAHSS